jgi:hypothetical protein
MIHCAVRWKSTSLATRSTSADTICTAVEPVPTMPMRRPSSFAAWSQRALWKSAPSNESSPGSAGTFGWWSTPVAAITTSASSRRPLFVSSRQRPPSNAQRVISSPGEKRWLHSAFGSNE